MEISFRKAEIHVPPRALAPHFQAEGTGKQHVRHPTGPEATRNAVLVERPSVREGADYTQTVVSAPF